MHDVEDELHVHGGLRHAGAPSMDDGDQSAVQLVHVALGEESAPGAGLVLHLGERERERTCTRTHVILRTAVAAHQFNKHSERVTMSACVDTRRQRGLMPAEVRTARWRVRALHAADAISL